MQVQTAYDKFSRFKKDISDVDSSTFIDWADDLNKMLYRHLLGIDPERFIKTQAYAVTATGNQTLPADFRDLQAFGCGIYDSNNDLITYTGYGQSSGYYINGSNLVFNETGAFTMRYIPTITTIDSLSDYFTVDTLTGGVKIIPDEYSDLVTKFLDVYYTEWDQDLGAEGISDQRFARLLDEFSRTVKRQPAVYGLNDFTTIY